MYQRPWYVLSCLWDDAYKRTIAANRKEKPMWRQRVSSLAEWSIVFKNVVVIVVIIIIIVVVVVVIVVVVSYLIFVVVFVEEKTHITIISNI